MQTGNLRMLFYVIRRPIAQTVLAILLNSCGPMPKRERMIPPPAQDKPLDINKGTTLPPTPSTNSEMQKPVSLPPTVEAPTAGCYKGLPRACRIELLILQKSNQLRIDEDPTKPPFQYDPQLGYIARQWSKDMGYEGQISHRAFLSGLQEKRYKDEFQTTGRIESENVAWTSLVNQASSDERKAETLVNDWWQSTSHHDNIMASGRSRLGVGVAVSADGAWYATQLFGK